MSEQNETKTEMKTESKIYKITSTKEEQCYINATTQSLPRALLSQRRKKECIVQTILRHDDAKIELIHNFTHTTNKQLQEELAVVKSQHICINKPISEEEKKETTKKLRNESYERNKETPKAYYEKNKEVIDARRKEIIECTCGLKVQSRQLKKHTQSKYHIANAPANAPPPVEIEPLQIERVLNYLDTIE